MKKYSLNDKLVLRLDEKLVFDANTFIVHKFNDVAMQIIDNLTNAPATFDEIICNVRNIDPTELESFINKAINAKIIVETKT